MTPSSPSDNFRNLALRIGTGVDVHAFAEGRKMILGGVEIPVHYGLAGHSDADVLLHAIIDAILGALAWGDIGTWFPDNDASYKDISSVILFRKVWEEARREGWALVNCDSTIIAQRPKLLGFKDDIQNNISSLFAVEPGRIGVKATTTEHLGFVGRGEGITALASILLERTP